MTTQTDNAPTNAELDTKIRLIEKDVTSIGQLLERLDIAIEKLTELSNAVNKIIAVHEERIDKSEKTLYNFKKSTDADIEKSHSILLESYKELKSKNEKIECRISKLEKKVFWMIGGGAFILGLVTIISQFFSITI